MLPSNTICVSQEGPANALALNKDGTQVVIAGRNVFKVFSIGENDFSEVCNLRVGKNLNLNFSSIDVAWSAIEENTLATAATNGAVVVWNLSRSGRSKQEHVFSDHKRTVNKVSFHLTDPAMLISGSQDGMMKYFDLRMKEVARTFISNTESIRDVQFSPHQAHAFAAVSENGNVQLWDVRRHERCVQQHTAHSGPVFACDWHAAAPWLATASRDKTIKVWDMSTSKPNLEHTIYTIASVGHVKWRPQKKYQISSCALVLDCAVHVWDVRRPHVPLATFAEHRDVTTAVAWLQPHAFLSTSRDCSLYRHRFSEAAHPVLWANPQAVCVSARGEVALARPECPLPALGAEHAPRSERLVPALGRKQPTAGSLSPTAQAALERAFPTGGASTLTRFVQRDHNRAFVACAREYRIRGAPAHELAHHNAEVARKYQRHVVAHVWDIVGHVYAARAGAGPAPPAPRRAEPAPAREPLPAQPPYSAAEEEDSSEAEDEWAEPRFHMSGVLGMPTHSIYIPPARFAKLSQDDEAVWVPASTQHYVDEDAMDWTLPEEAFPLRAAPQPPAPPAPPLAAHACDDDALVDRMGAARLSGAGLAGSSSSSSGESSGSAPSPRARARARAPRRSERSGTEDECASARGGGGGCGVGGGGGAEAAEGVLRVAPGAAALARAPPFDCAPAIAAALRQHADLGDVQTAAVVMLALQEHRSDLFPYIDEPLQEQWLLGYIELMQRFKLFNQATLVIRCAWIASVWSLSQQSTSVAVCCGRCGRRTRPHQPCERCRPRLAPDLCAVCNRMVRGLYSWCQGCSHGGHLAHMSAWFQQHQLCPAGCGHHCEQGL